MIDPARVGGRLAPRRAHGSSVATADSVGSITLGRHVPVTARQEDTAQRHGSACKPRSGNREFDRRPKKFALRLTFCARRGWRCAAPLWQRCTRLPRRPTGVCAEKVSVGNVLHLRPGVTDWPGASF
jgi:hypothetical protein